MADRRGGIEFPQAVQDRLVRDLAPRHRTGLDGIVPEGMRAIRVTVSGALRPRTGSAVDVLASFDARSAAATSSPGDSSTTSVSGLYESPRIATRPSSGR